MTSHFYPISRLQFAYFQRVVLGNVLHIDSILRVFWGIEKCDGKTVGMLWKTGAAFGPFSIQKYIQYDAYISNSPGRCFGVSKNATGKPWKCVRKQGLHLDHFQYMNVSNMMPTFLTPPEGVLGYRKMRRENGGNAFENRGCIWTIFNTRMYSIWCLHF